MQGNEISDGFSTFEHLLGMSNHAFDDEFEISKTQPYLLINQEEKAVRFCTTFRFLNFQKKEKPKNRSSVA